MSIKIFSIRNTLLGEFVKCGTKVAWCSSGAAKNAWALRNQGRFDEQEHLEIVELTEAYYRLKGLEK